MMPNKKISSKIKVSPKTQKQNKMLVKFLKQTKEGKYAIIEKSSVKYTRLNQQIDSVQSSEEEYYYGLR